MLPIGNSEENIPFYCHVDGNLRDERWTASQAFTNHKETPAITWVRSRLIHPIHGRDAPIWVRINRAFFSAFICSYSNVPWNIDGPPFWTLSVDLMMAHAINQMLFKHYVCMRDVKRNLEYCSFFLFFL